MYICIENDKIVEKWKERLMEKYYTLKIYDISLVDFSVQADEFGRLDVTVHEINDNKKYLFPFQLLPDVSDRNLSSWLKGRTIPKNRRYVTQLLSLVGLTLNDTMGIIDMCKGLSVNDAYWVDNHTEQVRFDDINLYDNPLDETLAFIAYTGYTITQRHKAGLSPEWTTDGQFAKAWRRINGSLYLYKVGSDGFANAGMEPYSEYFASQVAQQMGISHVPYDLEKWKGKLASVCPLLNNKDIAFVPFWVVTGQSRFPSTLAMSSSMSENIFDNMRSMVVFDALICNVDRHAGNYGFLRDNHTGKVLGMAPLFDHNLSLFSREMERDFPYFLQNSNSMFLPATGTLSFLDESRIVMGEMQHEQLRKMIGFELTNHPQYPVSQARLSALNHYLQEKVEELLKIPVADEKELQKKMNKELERIRNSTN